MGPHHPDILDSNNLLAGALTAQGDLAASESLYVASLEVAYALHDGPHSNQASTHDLLGGFLRDIGRTEEAEHHLREVLRISRAVYGPNDIDTHYARVILGRLLYQQGGAKLPEALDLFRTLVATEGMAEALPKEYAEAQQVLAEHE